MSPIALILDGLIAVLLLAAIGFCWRLNASLTKLRAGAQGWAQAAAELNAAVLRAEQAVRGLRAASESEGAALDARIADARAVADEIVVLQTRMARASGREVAAEPPSDPARALARKGLREAPPPGWPV
jgi:hypothetical protein